MHLKRIDIVGFKSFAKKTVLDLDKNGKNHGLTCVVGPNGSGKSNISDAIRWVLGEQSYKTLRSKKSEDVIFIGSEKKSRSSYAEVSIFLDNRDKKSPIDFSEVLITRRLYRSGEGEYLINGSKVRLFDIQELLAKSGFGRSSYSIVNQGMVDQILFYSSEEKKVFFSEAVGVKQYELKKEQALRKLESTDRNLIRVSDILSELEPRLKTLRSQAKKAQDKRSIQEKLLDFQKKYYQSIWGDLFEKIEMKKETLKELEGELAQIKKEYEGLNKKIKDSFTQEEEKYKGLQVLRGRIEKLDQEKNQLREKIIRLSSQIEVKKTLESFDTGGFLSEEKELSNKIKDFEKEIRIIDSQKDGLKKEIYNTKDNLEIKDKKYSELQNKIYQFQKQSKVVDLGEISKDIKEVLLNQDRFLKRLKVCRTSQEISLLLNQANLLKKRIETIYKKISREEPGGLEGLEKMQLDLSHCLEEKNSLFKNIQELSLKLQSLEIRKKNLQDEIERLGARKEKIQEKLSKIKTTKSQRQDLKNMKEELKSLEKTLSLKEKELDGEKERLRNKEKVDRNVEKQTSSLRKDLDSKQNLISQFQIEITENRVELARLETRQNDLETEIKEELDLEIIKKNNAKEYKNISLEDRENLQMQVIRLKNKLFSIGEIDSSIDKEFEEVEGRFNFLSSQFLDLKEAKENLEKVIISLNKKIKTQFNKSFFDISKQFNKYFNLLFSGGQAELVLDPEVGVEIVVKPPGKRIKGLNTLSGGEKSLTSIALICAILSINPSPFCVLDEVDAALDENNTFRFLEILDELSKNTQFILITHNRETMKKADLLYGVTMDNSHISSLLSLKLE